VTTLSRSSRTPTLQGRRLVAIALLISAAGACSGSSRQDAGATTNGSTASIVVPGSQATTAPTQPTASQASSTTAPTTKEFVSHHYGFAITLPSDWQEQDATADWPGVNLEGQGSPEFANFFDARLDRTLLVASAPVPAGTKLADWQMAMVRGTAGSCAESPTTEATTLGGEPALAWTATCTDGFDVNKLATVHAGRGYVMYLPSTTANDDAEDRRIFEGIRTSFRFTG